MKRLLILLFPGLCLAVLLLCWGALGANGIPGPVARADESQDGGAPSVPGLALRVGLALALIVFLIVGAVYVLRVVGGRGASPAGSNIKVLDRCYLAPKRALYTVRMGNRVVVMGVTETSITPVMEMPAEESERLYPEVPSTSRESAGFAGLLRGITARMARQQT